MSLKHIKPDSGAGHQLQFNRKKPMMHTPAHKSNTEALPPLPSTDWVLHMPARPYESEWTSSEAGYDDEQMRAYARQALAQPAASGEPASEGWRHLLPYGYAPGNYISRCIACDDMRINMDKRAIRCRPCAEKEYATAQPAPAPAPACDQFDKLVAELDATDPAGMAKARRWAATVLGSQPAPAQMPLTDAQIDEEWFDIYQRPINAVAKARLLARAIEAAHCIAAPGAPDAQQGPQTAHEPTQDETGEWS